MISPAARPIGIALLFATAVLAILLAPALSSPPGVTAHPCDDSGSDMHQDFHETPCGESGHDSPHENVIEVDGGRDNKMVFRVFPPPGNASPNPFLGDGDKIRITLKEFRLPSGVIPNDQISIGDSDIVNMVTVEPSRAIFDPDFPETLVLTLPDLTGIGFGEHLIITIKKGTGILAPETPRGFSDPTRRVQEDGYPVRITFVDVGGVNRYPPEDQSVDAENFVVVKNPVSSTEPGATVRVELATYANVPISSNEEIIVDFSGPSDDTHFILPSTISTSRIKIRPSEGEAFDPADVLVQGERVILTIPNDEEVEQGDFTISFSQLARIKNPFVAGNRVITVSSFAPGFSPNPPNGVGRALEQDITGVERGPPRRIWDGRGQ